VDEESGNDKDAIMLRRKAAELNLFKLIE